MAALLDDSFVFDASFDDIYQDEHHARVMGERTPIAEEDIKTAKGLAVVFDQNLLTPGRFFVDHIPLLNLCETRWWKVITQIIKPATVEPQYNTFLENCGGTPHQPPLWMSSDRTGETNRAILKQWAGGKGYLKSRREWKRRFPHAVRIVRRLNEAQVRPASFRAGSYSRHWRRRLKECALDSRTIKELRKARSRGHALELARGLAEAGSMDEWTYLTVQRAAISAKHDEVTTSVRARSVAKPIGPLETATALPMAIPEMPRMEEFPAMGGILDGCYGPDDLIALLDDAAFLDLRGEWLREFRAGKPRDEILKPLEQLCYHVAAFLKSKETGRSALVQILSISDRVRLHEALLGGSVPRLFWVLSRCALFLAKLDPTGKVSRRLHYNRRISKELQKAAERFAGPQY